MKGLFFMKIDLCEIVSKIVGRIAIDIDILLHLLYSKSAIAITPLGVLPGLMCMRSA